MPGSKWFEDKKPKWLGVERPKQKRAAVVEMEVYPPVVYHASNWAADADAGELRMLEGEFYWVLGSNVYEYDQLEERPGDYVGRVRVDETIDREAVAEIAVEAHVEVAVEAPVEVAVEAPVEVAVEAPVKTPAEIKRRRKGRSTVSRSTQEIRRLKAVVNKLRSAFRLRAERHTADIKMLRAIIRLLA
jgi:hypothetical protein